MTYLRQRNTDIQTGREEGRIETAENLLKMKLGTVEQIAQAAGLPVEKVLELKNKLEK